MYYISIATQANQTKNISMSGKVILYYWSAQGSSVGHISLQTVSNGDDDIYASFWPDKTEKDAEINRFVEKKSGTRYDVPYKGVTFAGVPGKCLTSLEDDQLAEKGRKPDRIIELYDLDVERIKREFERFKESRFNWSLWGSSIFKDLNTCNCSGLCAILLKAGGINKLIQTSYSQLRKRGFIIGVIGGFILALKKEKDLTNKEKLAMIALSGMAGLSFGQGIGYLLDTSEGLFITPGGIYILALAAKAVSDAALEEAYLNIKKGSTNEVLQIPESTRGSSVLMGATLAIGALFAAMSASVSSRSRDFSYG